MGFSKWLVSPFNAVREVRYSKETEHFYMHERGRGRDAKDSTYHRYFDTEQQAREFVEQRKADKAEQWRVERIKSFGVELMEALENLMAQLDPHDYPDEQIPARAVIAKARGEA